MGKRIFLTIAVSLLAAGWALAVPPTSTDQLGNPEEPAMRPVKWAGWGVYSLMEETRKGFMKGAQCSPAAMVYETGAGVVRGTGSLIAHVVKGSVYAPLPERRDRNEPSYEEKAMAFIREHAPSEQQAAQTAEPAAPDTAEQQPEDPGAKYRQPAPSLAAPPMAEALQDKGITTEDNVVTAAQRKYVPERMVNYRRHVRIGRGDLTKLAD